MKILYIGQYSKGSTSKMRAIQLKKILNPENFIVIDTNIPFCNTNRAIRSIGFRFKLGPLIKNTNSFVFDQLDSIAIDRFDLIWVDKAIFITKETTIFLKQRSKLLVHFTPDMAFYGNKSTHFLKSLPIYDYVITTKSKEIPFYNRHIIPAKIILTTQGYDLDVHTPFYNFDKKKDIVAFIGLAEPSRINIVRKLINSGIHVKLAGKGWKQFIKNNQTNSNLEFVSESLINKSYSEFISSAKFSLGLLSKQFPELHTTRTFEIPACGTALITERNIETLNYFTDEEAIFFSTTDEIICKIKYFQNRQDELEQIIQKGRARVIKDGRDYKTILENALDKIKFDQNNLQ